MTTAPRINITHMAHTGGSKDYDVILLTRSDEVSQVIVRFGKVGARGQIKAESEESNSNGRAHFNRKIQEKHKRGYNIIAGDTVEILSDKELELFIKEYRGDDRWGSIAANTDIHAAARQFFKNDFNWWRGTSSPVESDPVDANADLESSTLEGWGSWS